MSKQKKKKDWKYCLLKLSFEISLIRFLIGILKITFQLNSSLALFLTGYTTLNKIYKKRSGMSRSKSLLCSKCILLGIVFAWWVFSVHVFFLHVYRVLKENSTGLWDTLSCDWLVKVRITSQELFHCQDLIIIEREKIQINLEKQTRVNYSKHSNMIWILFS